MVCRRVTSFPRLLAILTLILLTFGKSFSGARQAVVEVSTVVATQKEFAVPGDSSLSLQKENIVVGDVPSAAAEVKTYKIGGRRMSYSSGDQKGQVLMAFALDYTSPRAHPPSHN